MIETEKRKGHIEIQIAKVGGLDKIRQIYSELNSVKLVCDWLIDEGAIIEQQSLKNYLKRNNISLSTEGKYGNLGSSQRAFMKLCENEKPAEFLSHWYAKTESVIELTHVLKERFSAEVTYHRITAYLEEYGIDQFKTINKSKVQRIVYEREGRSFLMDIYQSCEKDLDKTIAYFEREFDAVISRFSLARWLKVDERPKAAKTAKVIPFDRAAEFGIDTGACVPLEPVIVYENKVQWGMRDKFIYKKDGDKFAKWHGNLHKVRKDDGLNSIWV